SRCFADLILDRHVLAGLLLLLLTGGGAFAQEPADTNFDEAKVPAYELPDPLVDAGGKPIADADTWHALRRQEILREFETNIYGRTPKVETQLQFRITSTKPDALDGLATRKEIAIQLF